MKAKLFLADSPSLTPTVAFLSGNLKLVSYGSFGLGLTRFS